MAMPKGKTPPPKKKKGAALRVITCDGEFLHCSWTHFLDIMSIIST